MLTEKEKTGEDQGEYIGHCQPKKGTGRSVAECVIEHLKRYEADTSELKVVFTDGTSKMTGCHSGAIRWRMVSRLDLKVNLQLFKVTFQTCTSPASQDCDT